jgi:2-oxo-3-hexenedioate decarboxylase/2-keto-4-pentenoate hydratase
VPLGPAAIDRAAALLERARRDITTIAELPEDVRPHDLADAYAISDRLDERLGWEVAGWYLGATNVAIQELLGLDGPYVARVYRRLLHMSPATLRADDFPPMVVECEFSFALRSDLEARATPYSHDEVAAAVDSVHASIEVVAGHLEDWMRQDVWSVIADNGTDGAEIVGSGCALHGTDLAAVQVTLERNGEPVRHGTGADVLGDPFDAFVWLANERRAAGDGLRAGMYCNTGTATAICPVGRGDHLVATFGGVGVAELSVV